MYRDRYAVCSRFGMAGRVLMVRKEKNMTQLEMERRIVSLESEIRLLKDCLGRTLNLISKNTDAIIELNDLVKLIELTK